MGIAETRISQLQDRVAGLSVPASAWNAKNAHRRLNVCSQWAFQRRGTNIGALPIPRV